MATLNEIKFLSKSNANTISTTDNNKLYLVETPVITEAYVSGNSWYRIWSNGWIEQGGYSGGGAEATVSFLRPFTITTCTILFSPYSSHSGDWDDQNPTLITVTLAYFKYKACLSGAYGSYWYACGR